MFQRFLQDQERQKEVQIVRDLQANMQTLNQLVAYLDNRRSKTQTRRSAKSSELIIPSSLNCVSFWG